MQRVTQLELAARLCEVDHPRMPPVRSSGGTPCARHIRQATDQWYLTQSTGRVDLEVLREASEEEMDLPNEAAAIAEAWGLIANAMAHEDEGSDWSEAADAWRAKWMPVAADAADRAKESPHAEPV